MVHLHLRGNTHVQSQDTADLLKRVGGREAIHRMTNRFYQLAFQDTHLCKFVTDQGEPHGQRLGDWIVEKMGGYGDIWTQDCESRGPGQPRARAQAHRRAWESPHREPSKKGRRFKLDDCRVWMRCMFRAAREVGLADDKEFFDWYVEFISHFIAVYEWTAPPFTQESADWSADPANIEMYEKDGFTMKDVVGVRASSRWEVYND